MLPIDELDLPFDLPLGWQWIQLGDVCYVIADGPHFSPKYVDKNEGVAFLSARNISVESIDLTTAKYVSREDHENFCKCVRIRKGDILYTKGGTTGIAKVNDIDTEFSVWVHVAVLQIPLDKVFNEYLALTLNSPHCYEQSQKYTHGIGNKDLGLTRMINITTSSDFRTISNCY
ncbi:restriction endonuclease subunit S [Kosakonia radicincitans]|nr:restriction endonuclease subunit S [Kosakonia radicincitans]